MNVTKTDFFRLLSPMIDKEILNDMWEELEVLSGKMEKYKIKIMNENGDFIDKEVNGLKVGQYLFVNRQEGSNTYNVSHIDTGGLIGNFRTKTIAIKAAKKLSSIENAWHFKTLDEFKAIPQKKKDILRQIIFEYKNKYVKNKRKLK